MRLTDLLEALTPRKVLVIFPGGFHPLLKSHISVYNFIRKKFPQADTFIASSNDTTDRPFSFKDKQFLASQAGIPADHFVEVTQPYKSLEITKNYNPKNTILIFALSKKDKDRLGSPIKKDGSPSFLQSYPNSLDKCETFDKHGYYVIAPMIQFNLLGREITSATQIREWYGKATDKGRLKLAKALYPNSQNIEKVKEILDRALVHQSITETVTGSSGWLTPKGKFIPNERMAGHWESLKEFGIDSYESAYQRGWIHITCVDDLCRIETGLPFEKVEKRAEKVATNIQSMFPIVYLRCGNMGYDWTGKEFVPYNTRHLREALRYSPYRRLPPTEYKKKYGSKTCIIDSAGWLLPDKTFVPNRDYTHVDTAYFLGYGDDYDQAFAAGCLRIATYGGKGILETAWKMSPKIENLALNGISRMKNIPEIELYTVPEPVYYKRFKWNGRDLIPQKISNW